MSERGSLPAQPQQTPGFPSNFRPILWEGFTGGLQTKTSRPGIKPEEMSICDGWFPVAPNMLRTLPGIGDPIYTGGSVVWFGFGNIGDQRYLVVLKTDGAVVAVTLPGGIASTVMPPGTIASPTTVFGFTQWGSQYLLFCAPQSNGYWLWDGHNLFKSGTASPIVDITDGGRNYTAPPTISAFGGSGSLMAFSSQLDNDAVSLVTVTNPGTGYKLEDKVVLLFNGSGTRTAVGTAVGTDGVITSVTLLNGGKDYTDKPDITVNDPTGTGAVVVVESMQIISTSSSNSKSTVTALKILDGGHGYTSPTISFSGGGGGSGASATCFAQNGVITGFTLIDGGVGYQSTPEVQFVSFTGAGAAAKATVGAGGAITQVQITAGGSDYTGQVIGTFVGGNGPAVATLEMMPFGISGTWLEVYQGHVWIGNGGAVADFPPKGRVIFSAPGSPVDFGLASGAFLDTNSFARVGYHAGKQTNGFLYLIADSSLDYVSGVQTSVPAGSTIATTTFNNQNADPQIGSPWASSVQVFRRNIVFANPIGIYISLGGATTKISDALDGFYASSPTILGATANFSSAIANIFGSEVYMLLLPVVDQVTRATVNKLLMWDGTRWFTSSQDVTLTYLAAEEFNSILTAYGTDGTNIYPLFNTPSTRFTKTAQSKLYANPGYWEQKTGIAAHGVLQNATTGQTLTLTVDNENGTGTGAAQVSITGSNPVGPDVFNVFGPITTGQNGYLLGLTAATTAGDMTIQSMMLVGQDFATNV